MGNFTGKISINFAHAQAVSSRPPFGGLVKEASLVQDHVDNFVYF